MMIELMTNEYEAVLPLIKGIEFDTVFAYALIEGKQTGRIFADKTSDPSVALIIHYFGMALLCGDHSNEQCVRHAADILLRQGKYHHDNFRLIVHPDGWEEKLKDLIGEKLVLYSSLKADETIDPPEKMKMLSLLSGDNVIGWQRSKMRFDKTQFKYEAGRNALPDGLTLMKIDRELYNRIDGQIVPKSFWDSYDDFCRNGIGYCLMRDEEIISTSFAAYISESAIDIGVETSIDFRGKGLAIFPCSEMVRYCLENGYEPVWGCRKDNQSSLRLAQKLGFKETMTHTVYWPVNMEHANLSINDIKT